MGEDASWEPMRRRCRDRAEKKTAVDQGTRPGRIRQCLMFLHQRLRLSRGNTEVPPDRSSSMFLDQTFLLTPSSVAALVDRMWPVAPITFLLLLPPCLSCVFCRDLEMNLKGRFDKLCQDYQEATDTNSCTSYPEPNSFSQYGIDIEDVFTITEKTHRVFRVLEISQDRLGIAAYWNWLHKVKLVEYTHNEDAITAFNCTECRVQSMKCLTVQICYPVIGALDDAIWNNVSGFAICFLVGLLAFSVEYCRVRRRRDPEEKIQ
ncbi:sperm-egg fusion protein TMEM95 isoform X2 [Hyperolius riggenbachi]|uniref:sperm-egg fusion protein TMEM95 isoform X2 n=1 Tax=Hyperolius riggenbachi TaxID=752182 RepID=UPI0035A3196C